MLNKVSLALGLVLSVSSISTMVQAHGWAEYPSARQSTCYNDGGFWSNSIPNAACKAAFDMSGATQFIQRNEVASLVPNYTDINAVKANIKDGELCSASMAGKDGLNVPHTDWQKTEITLDENGQFDFVWTATAPHNPSFWEFYLTKPGHDFSQPLDWDDLDLVYTVGNVDPTDGSPYKTYNFKVKLPTDRAGDAILYSRWQREDAAGEGFYNCSDIIIKQSGGIVPPPVTGGDMNAIPGYFVPAGSETPAVGDIVRFRLMAPVTGSEVYDHKLEITAENQATWAQTLANEINALDSEKLFVGVWNDVTNTYEFNTSNINANQVWVSEKDYAFAVSTIKALKPFEPTPPPGNYPAFEAGKKYEAGEKVTGKDGNNYSCKPWPATGWCSQASYEPGVSAFWSDAWDKL